jgi:hypothetical protein
MMEIHGVAEIMVTAKCAPVAAVELLFGSFGTGVTKVFENLGNSLPNRRLGANGCLLAAPSAR